MNITLQQLLILLAVGLVAGFVAGLILRGRGLGLVGNLIVGVLGSFLGSYLFRLIGFQATTTLATLITAIAGATLLLWLLRFIPGRKGKG
jgi:uncharacterized membrane protein YeaQ/YmgE (transglycosylase-associated protein family)